MSVVKLSYLFSRNNKAGSKLIAWASGLLVKDLEKVPSHMALLIESEHLPEPLVLESVLEAGVRIVPYTNWKQLNEECYKIQCPSNKTLEDIFALVREYWGKKYDWPGIAFFALCFIGHFLFKLPFPKDNAWQSDNKYFCNELGGKLAGYEKYSMVTPAKMCSDFLRMTNGEA